MEQLVMCTNTPDTAAAGLSHKEVCQLWNSQGGAQIRWNPDINEYTTISGDRYPKGDVEEGVRHLARRLNSARDQTHSRIR